MNRAILSKLRTPRAPDSLKQIVMTSCKEVIAEPIRRGTAGKSQWVDRCLQAAATFAVFLFALTCLASFITDSAVIASAGFTRIEDSRSTNQNKHGSNDSFLVMRRRQSWP